MARDGLPPSGAAHRRRQSFSIAHHLKADGGKGLPMGFDPSLEPLATLGEFVGDMAQRARSLGLAEAIQSLQSRKLRIATMCSGTDAPIIAFQRLVKHLQDTFGESLDFEHVFSAEIDVNKAAFIRRNAGISLIFTDIRQVAFNKLAATHYGAAKQVPGNLDVVIAGFSCVDFSRLNANPKSMDDLGESGDTFAAIRMFARENRPNCLILENVTGAPWAKGRKEREKSIHEAFRIRNANGVFKSDPEAEEFWGDHPGYAGVSGIFNSADFYLPHSRGRGYMILANREKFPDADNLLRKDWYNIMTQLQRRASVSIEALCLKVDDPRLQQAQEQMTRNARKGATRSVATWILSAGRHDDFRRLNLLGNLRTILKWTEGGTCEPRDFTWILWIKPQQQRIKDSIEINTLRNVQRGYDSEFKFRIWELSQNIDRDCDTTRWGLVKCLVGSGIYYITTRGGLMTGREALSFQGLPIDEMLLSRETNAELINLAGNAMSAPVVLAALIASIIVLHKGLGTPAEAKSRRSKSKLSMDKDWLHKPRFVQLGQLVSPYSILEDVMDEDATDGDVMDEDVMDEDVVDENVMDEDVVDENVLDNQPRDELTMKMLTVQDLLAFARQTVRLCYCEGQVLVTQRPIQVCLDCWFSSCSHCGGNPMHRYGAYGENVVSSRLSPQVFRSTLEQVLPMKLQLVDLNFDPLLEAPDIQGMSSSESLKSLENVLIDACNKEFKFKSMKRSHCWTITYEAPSSRLELILNKQNATWLLYAEPDRREAGTSKVRELLAFPVARMVVNGEGIRDGILQGVWEVRQPTAREYELRISALPHSQLGLAWESTLGLEDPRFKNKMMWNLVQISSLYGLNDDDVLLAKIIGEYERLPACGTASGSLYKRVSTESEEDVFLFLDPARCGNPKFDGFCFSSQKHRLEYGEQRDVIGTLDSSWRPDSQLRSHVTCIIPATWVPVSGSLDSQTMLPSPTCAVLNETFLPRITFGDQDCNKSCAAILSFTTSLDFHDLDLWTTGKWTTVGPTKYANVLSKLSFALKRAQALGGFSPDSRPLSLPRFYQSCQLCAPDEPDLLWECHHLKNLTKAQNYTVRPYENENQALAYEEAMKKSPIPFPIQTRIDGKGRGRLRIGLNVQSLFHRALAQLMLSEGTSTKDISGHWRLFTDHGKAKIKRRRYWLQSNSRLQDRPLLSRFEPFRVHDDPRTIFRGLHQLRPEQMRALRWMRSREETSRPTYVHSETVEAVIDPLNLRAEATVTRDQQVLGGICSDQVGFGKTILILALIMLMLYLAAIFAAKDYPGRIPLKATLIIVPPTLCIQWCEQVKKFLGDNCLVLLITTINQMQKLRVNQYRKADIVIVSWSVFQSPSYADAMAHLGTVPPGPNKEGRAFDHWLQYTDGRMADNIDDLKEADKSGTIRAAGKDLRTKLKKARIDRKLIRTVPLQLKHGRKYIRGMISYAERKLEIKARKREVARFLRNYAQRKRKENAFNFARARTLGQCKGFPLNAFAWFRKVVDEHTYMRGQTRSFVEYLAADRGWILSGTPPLANFGDIQECVRLIGIRLGIDDDNPASMSSTAIKKYRNERTSAEKFRGFDVEHSEEWYLHREIHAQTTLNVVARQNQIPINLRLPCREIIVAITLSPAEKIVYLALQQALYANDMIVDRPGKNEVDPAWPTQVILQECASGQEALLRCASMPPYLPPDVKHHADSIQQLPYIGLDVEPTQAAISNAVVGYHKLRKAKAALGVYSTMKKAYWLSLQISGDDNTQNADAVDEQANDGDIEMKDVEELADIVDVEMQEADGEDVEAEDAGDDDPQEDDTGDDDSQQEREVYWHDLSEFIENEGFIKGEISKELKDMLQRAKRTRNQNDGVLFYMTYQQSEDAEDTFYYVEQENKPPWTAAKKIASQMRDLRGAGNRLDYAIRTPRNLRQIDRNTVKPLFPAPGEETMHELRVVCGELREQIKGFIEAYMDWSFHSAALRLQVWNVGRLDYRVASDPRLEIRCSGCGMLAEDPNEIAVLGVCGHFACSVCLADNEAKKECWCPEKDCREPALPIHVHRASTLGKVNNLPLKYSSKIDAIVETVLSIPEDEQVLIFSQYSALGDELEIALEKEGVTFYSLNWKLEARCVDAIDKFQKNSNTTDKDYRQVLMLDPSKVTAAGASVDTCSHSMFAPANLPLQESCRCKPRNVRDAFRIR